LFMLLSFTVGLSKQSDHVETNIVETNLKDSP
jgi:hypothetical protein